MGGYITRYENNFDFVTIRGAGHIVPRDRPNISLTLLDHYLKNESLPVYVAPPSYKNRKRKYYL